MGFYTDEGYYEKHVKKEGYKITDEQQKFNATDDLLDGIEIAANQHAKDHGIDKSSIIPIRSKKKEPIEYVVEEEKGEIVSNSEFERRQGEKSGKIQDFEKYKDSRNITQEKASGGFER